jgi:hypothetical protein
VCVCVCVCVSTKKYLKIMANGSSAVVRTLNSLT